MISKEINHIYWRWQEAIRERFENDGDQLTVAKPSNDGHLSVLKEMMLKNGFTTEEANSVVLILEKDKKAPPLDKAGKDEFSFLQAKIQLL